MRQQNKKKKVFTYTDWWALELFRACQFPLLLFLLKMEEERCSDKRHLHRIRLWENYLRQHPNNHSIICHILNSTQTQLNLCHARGGCIFCFYSFEPFPRNKIKKSPKRIIKPTQFLFPITMKILPFISFRLCTPHLFTPILSILSFSRPP